MAVKDFFAFARERHAIWIRRSQGQSYPWTQDPILGMYKFTNVFRELDRTTAWFRENVRERLAASPDVLLATVIFRWFNRIKTGEAIFTEKDLLGGDTAWFMMMTELDMNNGQVRQEHGGSCLDPLRVAITQYCGSGPYVTGAYIIKTPDGYNKLDGVLRCIEWFMEQSHSFTTTMPNGLAIASLGATWRDVATSIGQMSLEQMWEYLRQFPYLGDFMAYEVVTDLRHTALLDRAPDINTWANPGPGATRGLGRIFGDSKDTWNQHRDKLLLIERMRDLLKYSRDPQYWPQSDDHGRPVQMGEYCENWTVENHGPWPAWEMREVEHTLCEFDKYERVRLGEGRPRSRYP